MRHFRRPRCQGHPVRSALLCLTCALGLWGCSHVAPYEREALAHPAMDTSAREQGEASFYGHVVDAREAAGSTGDVAGGGCGCN